jgi:mannose-6-phosphate isomerase-like protein (cupin superfamily)
MQSTTSKHTTIFAPNQGKLLSFSGQTITCKFNPNHHGWYFFELLATADSPVPLHYHPWDEMSYLLEGEVDLQFANQTVRATPGYFINLPAGVAHAFTVRSPQARFLVGVSQVQAMQFAQELDRVAQERRLTPEVAIVIAQKYQVQVIS